MAPLIFGLPSGFMWAYMGTHAHTNPREVICNTGQNPQQSLEISLEALHSLLIHMSEALMTEPGLMMQLTDISKLFILTPSRNAEPVDHGGMGVGAHQTVWVQQIVCIKHDTAKVLKVHLMHDAGAWWYNEHVPQGLGSPLAR